MTDTGERAKPDLSNAVRLHQAGQLDAARAAYENALAAHPDHADAHNLLGVLDAQEGRLAEAMDGFSRATDLDAGNADYWYNRGECARRLERPDDAIAFYETALRLRPDHTDAFNNLTVVLARTGRYDALLERINDGLATNPDATANLVQIGQELLGRAALGPAQQLFEALYARRPDDRIIARNLSVTHLRQGKLEDALELLRTLVRAHPGWPDALHLLGVCLEELDQVDPAIGAFREALRREPGRIDTMLALVRLHERRREPAAARTILDGALDANPNEARLWARLGQHLERVSEIDRAKEAATKALALDARNPAALTVLVQAAAREKDFEHARALVRESADLVRSTPAEIRFSYAAGRVCEAGTEYEEALEFYRRANTLTRDLPRARRTPSQDHLSRLQESRRAFEADDGSGWHADAGAEPANGETDGLTPVFLVGFPRSGTTLLERLIGRRPGINITDELPTMQAAVRRFHEIAGTDCLTPATLDCLTPDILGELRAIYRDRLSSLVPQALVPGTTLIDKNPMSIADLPLIARMFPNSPLLVLLRDPRDTCLSCYTTEFAINRTTHLFTDMGDTVALFEAVMGLWRAIRPALDHCLMEVRYEELAGDVGAVLPEILDFCGIAPAGSSTFSAGPAAQPGQWVNTASYNAVAEPVHQRAIARWQQFDPFMGDQFAPLTPYIDGSGTRLRRN